MGALERPARSLAPAASAAFGIFLRPTAAPTLFAKVSSMFKRRETIRSRITGILILLEEYLFNLGQIWILWPSSRLLLPKVRVIADFMVKRLFMTSQYVRTS